MIDLIINFVTANYNAEYLWLYLLGGFAIGLFAAYQLFRLKEFIRSLIFRRY